MLKLFTGAHENFALEAVLNDHVESVKCITDNNRGYYSSTIAGFTIEVTLKSGASAHLGSLIKISKEDEDAIAEQQKAPEIKRTEKYKENMYKKFIVK